MVVVVVVVVGGGGSRKKNKKKKNKKSGSKYARGTKGVRGKKKGGLAYVVGPLLVSVSSLITAVYMCPNIMISRPKGTGGDKRRSHGGDGQPLCRSPENPPRLNLMEPPGPCRMRRIAQVVIVIVK